VIFQGKALSAMARASGKVTLVVLRQIFSGIGRHEARTDDEDGAYGGRNKQFTTSHDAFSNL